MSLKVLSGPTILAGKSMSDGVDCTGSTRILRFIMPSAWTAAPLSFQLSPDGVSWNNLYNTSGPEFSVFPVSVANPNAGSVIALPVDTGHSIAWLRFRSGTFSVPVAQAADRVFQVVLEMPDAAASGGGSDLTDALSAMFAPIVTGAVMNPSIADMISNPPGSAVVQMQAGNGNYTTMVPPPTWSVFSETLNGQATSGWWTIDQYGNLIPASTTASKLNVDDYAVVRCQATNAFGSGVGDCMMTFAA